MLEFIVRLTPVLIRKTYNHQIFDMHIKKLSPVLQKNV